MARKRKRRGTPFLDSWENWVGDLIPPGAPEEVERAILVAFFTGGLTAFLQVADRLEIAVKERGSGLKTSEDLKECLAEHREEFMCFAEGMRYVARKKGAPG